MSEDYRPGDFWHNPQETLGKEDMLAGAGIMDSANTLAVGVDKKNDVAIGLGSVGLALDTLGLAIDPVGSLVSAAIGWLIEHLTPFRVPLDMLMGDPIGINSAKDAIDAERKKLTDWAEDHKKALEELRKSWRGAAADAFSRDMEGLAAHLDSLGKYVDSASQQMGIAGGLVGAFRGVIRDIIAGVLGGIIAGAFAAAAAMPFTFGASIPIFIGTVAATVGITMTKIGVQITKLTQKLTAARTNIDETGKLGDDAARAFADGAGGGPKPTRGGGNGSGSSGDAGGPSGNTPGSSADTSSGGAGGPGAAVGDAGADASPKPDLTIDTDVPKPATGGSPSSGATEYFTPDTSPRPGGESPAGSGSEAPSPVSNGDDGSVSSVLDGGGRPGDNGGNADVGPGGNGGEPHGNGDTPGGEKSVGPRHEPLSDKMVRYAKENLDSEIAEKLPHIRPAEHRIIHEKFDSYVNMGKPDLTRVFGEHGAARFESIVKTLTDPGYGARGSLSKSGIEFIKAMGSVHEEVNMNDEK